jgi:hypothetical protein
VDKTKQMTAEIPDSGNAAVPESTPDLILTRED